MKDVEWIAGFIGFAAGAVMVFALCVCLVHDFRKAAGAAMPETVRSNPQGADMTPIPVMEMECVEVKTTGYCHRYIIRRLTSME